MPVRISPGSARGASVWRRKSYSRAAVIMAVIGATQYSQCPVQGPPSGGRSACACSGCRADWFRYADVTDAPYPLLQREAGQLVDRQADEQVDATPDHEERR